ncbi:putative bifunctional diguanylate cyclase/phosphodiesterase [Massilia genomosp. 1]|uniref:putative bifunctional diguanylate cyclase/phosphodiesterase n=1 Tax=Massilia genomosp. 1 TaxID=2609280 RepID=UPI001E5D292F|nr:diguanylate cyclase [Massilia genomosp. 1]
MSLRAPTILIVDDEARNRRLLAVLLRPEGYSTSSAASGEEALAAIGAEAPDLILLDITMPGMDGYQVASILKSNPATGEEMLGMGMAELVDTSDAKLEHQYDALIAGGLNRDQQEMQMQRSDGVTVQVEVNSQAMRSGNDWTIVIVVRDITERKQAQQRVTHLAHHDPLTGLPNRTLFYASLQRTVALAHESGSLVALMFIDLDNFKTVNDTLGHAVGDELLVQFSNRLVQCVRVRDTVGRLGGDELALILIMQDGQQGAVVIADKIRDALRAPFVLHGHELSITAGIGITLHPVDSSDPATLIKYADTAMYEAKHAGRDTYRFFTAQMNADVLARLKLEKALRQAIEKEQFVLHYQPKVHLNSGRVAGLEALLRPDPGLLCQPPPAGRAGQRLLVAKEGAGRAGGPRPGRQDAVDHR